MPGPFAEESACGKNCLETILQSHDAKGTYVNMDLPESGKIAMYVTVPGGETIETVKQKKHDKIILWCCDVYGPYYANNVALMDYYASQGYLVLSPDYFFGHKLEHDKEAKDFDQKAWIAQFKTPTEDKSSTGANLDRSGLLLKEWLPRVKEMFGDKDTRYGIIGYCFGAPYVLQYCATDEVHAGAIVHPAFLDSDDDFALIKQPLHASLAEQDAYFNKSRRRALEDALIKISTPNAPNGDSADYAGEGGLDWTITVFSGVKHGWALRGDMTVPRIKWAREKSCTDCREW